MSYYTDDFKDFRDQKIQINWSEDVWKSHLKKHPELVNFENASKIIKSALEKPSLVLTGSCKKEGELITCYYLEHKRHQEIIFYTKVIVGHNKQTNYIKTVWEKSALHYLVVKEKNYNHFKEIWKIPKSYL